MLGVLMAGPHKDLGMFCSDRVNRQALVSGATHVAEMRCRCFGHADALGYGEHSGRLGWIAEDGDDDLIEDTGSLLDDDQVSKVERVEGTRVDRDDAPRLRGQSARFAFQNESRL